MKNISHLDTFIFDLDNTLYGADTGLMDQMHDRMGMYITRMMGVEAAVASEMRHRYWKQYGTTMAGLVAEHGVDPDHFMSYVHDLDLAGVDACARTRQYLEALPGRRIIFTNADNRHAERMLTHLGIRDLFEDVFDVTRVGFKSKPAIESYHQVLNTIGAEGSKCAMFEDSVENLRPAYDLGMTTIWVTDAQDTHDFVHHRTPNVLTWLEGVFEHDNSTSCGNEPRENENPQGRRHPA